jgi:hypothetical protein
MGRRTRLALGALVLTLTAGCGVREDPPAGPASPAGSTGTSAAATAAVPPPVGTTTLVAFAMVLSGSTGAAAEISGPDQIDGLVGGPPAVVESARAAVARNSGAGTRLFAFVLPGCQNEGAALAIQAKRVTAMLTGGEGIACFAAEWYLAVFAVPTGSVPPGARVG